MKNSETCERYEIEYQNADYYGEYKYADLLLMENMVGY